ncbi:hypothetical protein PN497_10675 [Sphaerospermopsis kisseleviana CS-549]|uniref:DUF7680 domain-containing protein n=1 Tax=Sphaerospermopsis kisseleviana CS-549 TaxID=3021783 RepID=A0ABT4ZRM9_9CYAN|nr:hypothetical protein [Sphaerospermopsis kisseleviana]MDB9441821.1 hypothetical protein [Sphaerospermopsis kisseleviana CS-549]
MLFATVQPLSKTERIANIAQGIKSMSYEESHYWFAKISHGKRSQALKAIRILSCYTAKLYNPNILNSCLTGKMPVPLIQIKCTTAY